MDDFIYDDIGFDTGSYGDVSNLFDYDFTDLFNSFGGYDFSNILDSIDLSDNFSKFTDYDFAKLLSSDIGSNLDLTDIISEPVTVTSSKIDDVLEGTGQENILDTYDVLPSDKTSANSGFSSLDNRSPTVIDIGPGASNTDAFDFLAPGNTTATADELVYEMNNPNIDVQVMDDGSKLYVDKETGKVIRGVDEEGRSFHVDEQGRGIYDDTGERTAGTPVTNFGGNLASKSDVDKLTSSGTTSGGTTSGVTKNDLKNSIVNPSNKSSPWPAILGGLLGALTSPKVGGARGYQGTPANLTATRTALSPTGAPGAGGKRFISPIKYAAEGGLMELMPRQPNESVTFMSAGGLPSKKQYESYLASLTSDEANKYDKLIGKGMTPGQAIDALSMLPADKALAKGGISSLGGYSDGGRMLKGPGDGMSDSIPATIGGKRPARLADGEFVVPADVVSHLGNGSTDAGADVLYEMMNRVRRARTGNPKQGKQINPHKFVPKARN